MTTCDVYGCDQPAEVEHSRGGKTVRLCRDDWDAPLVAIRGVRAGLESGRAGPG